MTPFPIPLTTPPDTRMYLVIVEAVSAEDKFCGSLQNSACSFSAPRQTRQNNATRRALSLPGARLSV